MKELIEFFLDLLASNEIENIYNNRITMIYNINKKNNKIRILGEKFVKCNKLNCKLLINNKKYSLCDCIEYSKYNINTNADLLRINLIGIKNITDASEMFCHSVTLKSLPDISKLDTKKVKSMKGIFCF